MVEIAFCMSDMSRRTPLGHILHNRFKQVLDRLPLSPDPLIAYAVLVSFCEVVILQALRVLEGYPPFFVVSPLWLLRPVILIGAAVVTRKLHRSYGLAVEEMALPERVGDASRFERLVPPKLAWGFVIIGVTFTLGNALFAVGIPTLLSFPIEGQINWLVIVPFGYVPVFSMFLATYLSIEIIFPHRIDSSEQLGLYYHDPENLGGMRPIGELMKHAYYYLLVGLVLYAIALYGPYLLQGVLALEGGSVPEPGLVTNGLFTGVWALSVGVMMYGIHRIHRFMHREKRERLKKLDALARDHIDQPWNVEDFAIPEESEDTYNDIRARMDLVSATNEYPATFTMWVQLGVGVLIPKAVQLLLSAI
jgi:hypothetical protein